MAEPKDKGGQPTPETDPKDGKGTGGPPPAVLKDTPAPGGDRAALRTKEQELADTKAELAKVRGELGGVKDGSVGLRRLIAEADAKAIDANAIAKKAVAEAKEAEDAAKAAISAADKKAAEADKVVAIRISDAIDAVPKVAAAGDKPPVATATATTPPPKDPGIQPEPKRPDPPTPRTETQPIRRQPDPPHPTRIDNCSDDGRGQCCCHPFTRTWFWATVAAVLLIAFGAGIWWFSGTTATTTSPTAIMAPAPVDPLAADKGEFLIQCQSQGGTFEDCLNGFEAVTR